MKIIFNRTSLLLLISPLALVFSFTFVQATEEYPIGVPVSNVPLEEYPLGTPVAAVVSTGALEVTNCKPPGPPGWPIYGRDGTACTPIGTTGGTITGVCFAGKCRAVGFTTGGNALNMFTNSLIQGATQSITQQLLGGLFGGGYGGDYPTPEDYEFEGDFLDFGTTTPSGDLDLDFVFDDTSTDLDYTTNTVTETFVFNPDDYGRPEVAVVSVPNSVPGDNLNGYVTPITGLSQFEIDLASSSFNTDAYPDTRGGISLADLERDAAEARAREALLNERNGISNNLLDYRSSNVGGYNPLSGGEVQEEEDEKTWWQKILAAFGL